MTKTEALPSRRNRRPVSTPTLVDTVPRTHRYRNLINPFSPLRIYSDDEVEVLHAAALSVLEKCGIRVMHADARRYLAMAGALVDETTEMVRLDRAIVEQALLTVPRVVELRARNPQRTVLIGQRHVAFAPVAAAPNVTDSLRGRRPGSMSDYCDFVRLAQSFDVIHLLGPSVEPQDVPVGVRHLEMALAQLLLSDKVPWIFCRGKEAVQDSFEMVRMVHGLDEAAFSEHVYSYTVVNTNSPRQLDLLMADGVMRFALAGQLVIVTPFTLAGAMAPVSLSGALTLAHAEALATIVLSQIVKPGAPVAYGGFTSNVDMKSGSPAFGTPEYVKACFGAGQLARRVGVPFRSSCVNASNAADEQAIYESQMSLWGAMLGGCNILLHGAGWLEGGLTASYEKFMLDIEMLQMMAEVLQPVSAAADEIALDAIAEVNPGGHFFACAHTLQRYKSAFYLPLISDWHNFGAWKDAGARTASSRATDLWQSTLNQFSAPELDVAIREQLDEYVSNRRTMRGG